MDKKNDRPKNVTKFGESGVPQWYTFIGDRLVPEISQKSPDEMTVADWEGFAKEFKERVERCGKAGADLEQAVKELGERDPEFLASVSQGKVLPPDVLPVDEARRQFVRTCMSARK